MDSDKNQVKDNNSESLDADVDSLEAPGSPAQAPDAPEAGGQTDSGTVDTTEGHAANSLPSDLREAKGLRRLTSRVNVYLLGMVGLLFVAVLIVVATYLTSKKAQPLASIPGQSLSSGALSQLASGGVSVGSPDEILNIQSSSVFANKVLMRQDLEVAGNLQIGKTLSLNDLVVGGTAQVSQLQASKDLSVAGNTAIQGSATIGKGLQVSGGGNFSGAVTAPQITTSNLQLNGDLVLTHHVSAGGAVPGRSNGPALGGGGTASISGSDTAGSITINTGSGPAAGCLISVSFAAKFNNTPHILITPVGAAAGGTSYYVNRSSTGFSVCVATPPAANATFGYDYLAID